MAPFFSRKSSASSKSNALERSSSVPVVAAPLRPTMPPSHSRASAPVHLTGLPVQGNNNNTYERATENDIVGCLQQNLVNLTTQIMEYQRLTVSRLDSVEDNLRESRRASSRASSKPTDYKGMDLICEEPIDIDNGRFTSRTSSGTSISCDTQYLLNELELVRKEVQSTKREMMNEIHMTKYDLLKEMTCLKGAVIKLVDAMQAERLDAVEYERFGEQSPAESNYQIRQPSDIIEPAAPYLPGQGGRNSRGISVETTRSDQSDFHSVKTYPQLPVNEPVNENALSKPISQDDVNKYLPVKNFHNLIVTQAAKRTENTLEWAVSAFEDWAQSPIETTSNDRILAFLGAHGTGKTLLATTLCMKYSETLIAASHFCTFDDKADSNVRDIVLSIANQLTKSVPAYRNQLARLNLPYVVEEPDAIQLATKLLIEPLCAMPEPASKKVVLLDGIDACNTYELNPKTQKPAINNELVEFLSLCGLEFPTWVAFCITSQGSKYLENKIPISKQLKFDVQTNQPFVIDVTQTILKLLKDKISKDDEAQAVDIIKTKSEGNYLYLNFVKQAFSLSGVTNEEGLIEMDILEDLPDQLYEIYEDIFEEKYGKGRRRLWKKIQPLLELITAAAASPNNTNSKVSFITESMARDIFSFSRDDLNVIRRSFADIVSVVDGCYRIKSFALYDWMIDLRRVEEKFYIRPHANLNIVSAGDSRNSSRVTLSRESSRASTRTSQSSSEGRSSSKSSKDENEESLHVKFKL